MELRCRRERAGQEQELEATAARHKLSVQTMQKEQAARERDEMHAQELRFAQEKAQMELANERERHTELMRRERESVELQAQQLAQQREQELKKFEALNALGVDLSAYLCALATARPDQHLRIESAGMNPPAVHLDLPKLNGHAGGMARGA